MRIMGSLCALTYPRRVFKWYNVRYSRMPVSRKTMRRGCRGLPCQLQILELPSLMLTTHTKRFRCFGKTSSFLLLMRIIRRMRVSAVRMRIIVERIRMRIMGSLCICLSVVTALRAKATQDKTWHRDHAPQSCLQKGSGKTIVG